MKPIIISLGGSIIVPEKININLLKRFRELILKRLDKNKFIIIVGGGKTCRNYQKAARFLNQNITQENLDWIGIHTTWLNADFVRTVFQDLAHPSIASDPTQKIDFKKILFAGGWKPGWSTDYDAVILAQTYGARQVINITNVPYLYDRDPKENKDAQIIKKTDWKTLRKIVGNKWTPGLNAPFDPEAAKLAQKLKLKLVLIGPDIKNLINLLQNKEFKGSVVEG